jgi:hypothetical protein
VNHMPDEDTMVQDVRGSALLVADHIWSGMRTVSGKMGCLMSSGLNPMALKTA